MARRDGRGEVTLPPGQREPYVHPAVAGVGQAEAYRMGLEARQAGNRLPKVNPPVAGGPTPPIPRLDGNPSQGGMTMAQHAAAERGVARTVRQPVEGGDFVERPAPEAPLPPLQILPMDILPDQAKSDPGFIDGHGSMFATHQPKLAMKYGVIRNGKPIAPQQLVPAGARPALRPETIKDLQDIQRLQQGTGVPNIHGSDAEAEASVSDAARAAGRVGNVPGDTSEKPLSKEERNQLERAVQGMDEFEFDQWRQAMMRDLLNKPEQKEIIEGRLKDMDLGDLITQGYVIQKVSIIPNKFEPAFKTTDGETDLALKRLIMEDAKSLEVSDRYYLDKFSLMSVAATLHSINGKEFLEHRDNDGNFDDEKFRKKFNQILKLPIHMLASLGLNALWFDMRVRKLFVAEKLGNG